MNIKVCGITLLKQIQQLEGLSIDFAGLVFQKASPRYVDGKIDKAELKQADLDIKKVGVFKDAEMIDILDAIDDYGLDAVQLDGNETVEMCEDLSGEVEVIKTFPITGAKVDMLELIAGYDDCCDYYQFNNQTGTAKKFDWKVLGKANIEKPFFISGGISLEDVAMIKKIKHPDFYGININSKFEKEAGVKDMALVLKLKQELGW